MLKISHDDGVGCISDDNGYRITLQVVYTKYIYALVANTIRVASYQYSSVICVYLFTIDGNVSFVTSRSDTRWSMCRNAGP